MSETKTAGEAMQQLSPLLKSKGFEITKDLYQDIELTKEESNMALYEARKAKAARLYAEEYGRRLREEPKYYKLDAIGIRAWALKKFKDKNNKDFIIDNESEVVLNILSAYFGNDQYFTSLSQDYSFEKGLAIFGNVGTGKTTLMRMFTHNTLQSYGVVSCMAIANEYIAWNSNLGELNPVDGYCKERIADRSAVFNPFGHEFFGICFDDLGTETIPAKNYGRELNVMAEIFLNRYNKKSIMPFNMTHFTTNLTVEAIEEKYGIRVKDRMREMFNVIQFDSIKSRR